MCFDCSVPLLLVCCVTILYCVALARRFAVFCSNIIQMKHSIINFDVTDFNTCVMRDVCVRTMSSKLPSMNSIT